VGAVPLDRWAPAAPARAPAVARPERARLLGFAALALFGALHWGALIRPARGGDMLLALLFALAGAGALIATPAGASDARRRVIVGAVAVALLVLALLTAGVPLRLLGPRGWNDLVSGMVDGISSTPGITVPYRGVDEWVQIAILSGGTALLALAALLAFWPRRSATLGSPLAAAVALTTLYAVPIIEHSPGSPYVDGTVFCLLLAAFLWLERLRGDQVAVAAACVLIAAIAGAVIAPRIDGTRPWFDYESFAETLQPKKTEAFSWTHSYGPLRWPRDGREMLRIKTNASTYWKVVNLADFDGTRWRQGAPSRDQLTDEHLNPKWFQSIRVVDRGLRSHEFVGAGIVASILPGAPRAPLPQPDGTYVAGSKPLRPGDSYDARVYVPRPTESQLKKASTAYPAYTQDFLEVRVPVRGSSLQLRDLGSGRPLGPNAVVRFAPYGQDGPVGVVWPSGVGVVPEGEQIVDDSPYRRLWALTQQIKGNTHSPYEFVQAVQTRVQTGAAYDEAPPARAYPLASFLFDTKSGYCQQFSGVMALMLRMGGVPARVASGFSPGTYNSERKDWVVRDTDAHSWVEAYFRPYGWVTFDPTPAASPANSQLDDSSPNANAGRGTLPNFGSLGQSGDRPFAAGDPGANVAAQDQGGGWELPAAAALVLLALSIGGVVMWRRRVPFVALAPELAELQRALHRSGRHPPPGVTLARLESLLGGTDAAAAYVRAVRDRRFGYAAPGPTPAQRRALRHQLGAGLGLRGKLRAWWALPPAPLKSRWRRPYTQT
jgi:protein-glutamine gamma-glutamyltransferase